MSLNDIVNLLPDESIDSALHDHLEGYRDGVFEHGKEAIEAVHQSDPELATRLVDAALHGQIDRQDLRKRQGSNETTTVVTTTSSETVVRDSTTSTRITTDTTTSTTQGESIRLLRVRYLGVLCLGTYLQWQGLVCPALHSPYRALHCTLGSVG